MRTNTAATTATGSWTTIGGADTEGIVATIMAIGLALVAQEQPEPQYSVFWV